jgi:hypothetical protein
MHSPRALRLIDRAVFAIERVRRHLLDLERHVDELGDYFRAPRPPLTARERATHATTTAIFKKAYSVKFAEASASRPHPAIESLRGPAVSPDHALDGLARMVAEDDARLDEAAPTPSRRKRVVREGAPLRRLTTVKP